MNLSIQDVAAIVGIVSVVSGAIASFLVLWLGTKFVNKKAYYADRREIWTKLDHLDHLRDRQFGQFARTVPMPPAPPPGAIRPT